MPIIPGVNQPEVKAEAVNAPYFTVKATEDAFGAGVLKSMLALGKASGDMADQANKAVVSYRQQQQKAAPTENPEAPKFTTVALPMPKFTPDISDAIELAKNFNDGVYGLQRDYFQSTGKEALDTLPEAMQGVDALQTKALESAASPESSRLAQSAIESWGQAAKDSLERHAVAQQRVYDDDLDNSQVAQSRDAVALLYNDDGNFLRHLHVAAEAQTDQALRKLRDVNPEAHPQAVAATIGAARAETASKLIVARIEGALDRGDLANALAVHRRWQQDLLPGDMAGVGRQLGAARFIDGLAAETQRIMAAPSQAQMRQSRRRVA